MAAGNVWNKGIDTVASNGYFSMQPTAGVEIVIHNISTSAVAALEFYDGTNYITIDTLTAGGGWQGLFLHCTNSKYYRIKNTHTSNNNIACDGVQTA